MFAILNEHTKEFIVVGEKTTYESYADAARVRLTLSRELSTRVVSVKWTCKGHERGTCGTRHETLHAAQICCIVDHQIISRGSPDRYSDRYPKPVYV